MPRRRRLLTPMKNKSKQNVNKRVSLEENEEKEIETEVTTPRGRLKGALKEVLEPTGEESDVSYEPSPTKRERHTQENRKDSDDDDSSRRPSAARQSYVLKLFDRSVDLSQFEENSPLYPICRAWIINQPKANYRDFGQSYDEHDSTEDSIELPGPEGPPVSRIPELLPEQKERNKDRINLDYREAPPPSIDTLIRWHSARWASVRQSWLAQAHKVEARYSQTHQLLNKINAKRMLQVIREHLKVAVRFELRPRQFSLSFVFLCSWVLIY